MQLQTSNNKNYNLLIENILSRVFSRGNKQLTVKEDVNEDVDYDNYKQSLFHRAEKSLERKDTNRKSTLNTVKIGRNTIYNLSNELLFKLFDQDSDGNNVPKSGFERKLRELGLTWLKDGKYIADKVYERDGNVCFEGVWKDGYFEGVMMPPSKIIGGYFDGVMYRSYPNGFKISPKDFIGGGYYAGNVLGMSLIDPPKNNIDKIHLIQIRKGGFIDIVDNTDRRCVIKILKNVDEKSADIKLELFFIDNTNKVSDVKTINLPWSTIRGNNGNSFDNYYIEKNQPFIPILNFDSVKSIKLMEKFSGEKSAKVEINKVPKKLEILSPIELSVNAFVSLPPIMDEYKEYHAIYNKITKDFSSGVFEYKMNEIKELISDEIINGFGSYISLKVFFTNKGDVPKKDSKEDKLMAYLNNLKIVFINNMADGNGIKISDAYLNRVRAFLNLETPQPVTATTTATTPPTATTRRIVAPPMVAGRR